MSINVMERGSQGNTWAYSRTLNYDKKQDEDRR